MLKIPVAILFWIFAVLPLRAEVSPEVQRLSDALGLPEIIEVMRDEGMDYGEELAETMFPGRVEGDWAAIVASIYDPQAMNDTAQTGLGNALSEEAVEQLTEFFESDLGVEIIALEISARRALMDEAVDDANKARVQEMVAAEDPRIDLLRRFIDVNDLLESNVVGALNSSYAFYVGLVDGGGYREPVSEDQILSDVWQQEPEIRAETEEWLLAFLSMAYSPLSGTEMLAYIEFSETEAGQALNTALFAGFDQMFEDISRQLGLAAASVMASEEL